VHARKLARHDRLLTWVTDPCTLASSRVTIGS
jgi:hypothetical protein